MGRISIIIRTLNEAGSLPAVLDGIRAQTDASCDVVVVDSGSTDRTREVARAWGARVEALPMSFSFGGALNWAINQCDSDLVAFLSGHAVPKSNRWLEQLTAPFADARVAGTFGGQVPHPGCFLLEAESIVRAYPPPGSVVSPSVRMSNANAAIRRAAWAAFPFDETVPGAEDALWAEAVTRAGWRVEYVPSGAVWHSHNESFWPRFRRSRREIGPLARAFPAEFAHSWPLARGVVSACLAVLRDTHRAIRGELPITVLLRAVVYRFACSLGRAAGIRDARRGPGMRA